MKENFVIKKPVFPPTYLLVSIILMLALHFLFPGALVIPAPWNLLGLIPVGLALWIEFNADGEFHRAKTTVNPCEESSALVTGGVFSITRNPMYLGFVMIMVGIAMLLGSLTPYFMIVVFVVLIERRFIRFEEKKMEQQFGQAYLEYRKKVGRWI